MLPINDLLFKNFMNIMQCYSGCHQYGSVSAIHSHTAKVIFNTTGCEVSHKRVELYTLHYLVRVNTFKKKNI